MARVIGILLLLTACLWAGYIVDQPDAARGVDAPMDAIYGGRNFGTCEYFAIGSSGGTIGRYLQLVKFDTLDVLPAGAVIDSAILTLTSYATNGSFTAYCAPLLREWGEGARCNATVQTGESGYTYYMFPLTWTSAGAQGVGTDRMGVLDSCVMTAGLTRFEITASVQALVDSSLNYGLVIFPQSNGTPYYFARSSDYGTAAQRPKIEVWYSEAAPSEARKYYIWTDNNEVKIGRR